MVDFVLPVADMPQKLLKLSENAQLIKLPHADDAAADRARHDADAPTRRCVRCSSCCARAPDTILRSTSARPCCGGSSGGCR